MYSIEELANDFRSLGLRAGDTVMLHASVRANSRRVWRAMEEFDTSDVGAHATWPDRFFAKIVDSLLTQTGNYGGRVGNATTYLLRARELFDFALPLMKAVAADPRAAAPLTEGIGRL